MDLACWREVPGCAWTAATLPTRPQDDNELERPLDDNELERPLDDNELERPLDDNELERPLDDNELERPLDDPESSSGQAYFSASQGWQKTETEL